MATSVIIPTIGRVEQLARCLESLTSCDPRAAEIVVVVQGDPLPTTALVEQFAGVGARVVRCGGSGGGRSVNLGLREAQHDSVLVTDDDCTVASDWVAQGSAHLEARPDAIFTGQVLPIGDPDAVPSTIIDPVPRDLTGNVRVGALFRGNMAVRRSLLLAAGGFDERIVPSAEDNDLCYRWARSGRPLFYEPGMVVWHHDWRSREELRQVYADYGRGQGVFYAKLLRAGDPFVIRLICRDAVAGAFLIARTLAKGRRPSSDVRLGSFLELPAGIVTGWRRFADRHEGGGAPSAMPRRGFWFREALKRHLPTAWRRRARRLSRLRWITKARLLRTHGVHWRDRPLLALRYLLFDPEVESFTYELANREELLDFAAAALGHDRAAIGRYAAETEHDFEASHLPRRWWDRKRRLPLANRLLWYVAARATKPELVVETGIHDGLGSLVLLRALERNAREEHPGRLLSFDVYTDTGWLVDERLRKDWERVHGSTLTDLEPALRGRRVDMSVHDTQADEEIQRVEFDAVLKHRADSLLVLNITGAKLGVLSERCKQEGVDEKRFAGRSADHIHPGNLIALALFPASSHSRNTDD